MDYWNTFVKAYKDYASYLWNDEIMNPSWHSYFYWLIGLSILFFVFEITVAWRKNQPIPRKDFWLDAFYMFFNFFLFSLIIYNAVSTVVVNFFNDGIKAMAGIDLQSFNPMRDWPLWAVLLVGMFVIDFIQWWTHRLLHRVDWLWEFHKVHHSVEEMGFAAQMRYHWMENIVYRSLQYIPLALIGIGLHDFFIIYIFGFAWGHFNHANITVKPFVSGGFVGGLIGIVFAHSLLDVHVFDGISAMAQMGIVAGGVLGGSFLLGPMMRMMFNSPEMHIWHHAYDLPEERKYGVNFGLTLALWDYIFGTAYIPSDGKDIRLGFHDIESFPEGFVGQSLYGFKKK